MEKYQDAMIHKMYRTIQYNIWWVFFLQASELTTETTNYEEQEQELMMVCVEELCKCEQSCFSTWK